MISRRRMVFQLTALLDLLLVVLFAQYMETDEAARRSMRSESMRRQRAESGQRTTEQLKQTALMDRAKLADQIEKLAAENQRLTTSLNSAQARIGAAEAGRVDTEKRSTEQLAEIGEIFRQRLKIDSNTFNAYLGSASPAERASLLQEMQKLQSGRSASIVQYLRATAEFKKMCNLWEVHVFSDNTVRIEFDGQDRTGRFRVSGASDMANRVIDAAKENGEPRSLVVVLLTWSDADRKTRDEVTTGLQDAITVLRTSWGSSKRLELAKLGYTPEAP